MISDSQSQWLEMTCVSISAIWGLEQTNIKGIRLWQYQRVSLWCTSWGNSKETGQPNKSWQLPQRNSAAKLHACSM